MNTLSKLLTSVMCFIKEINAHPFSTHCEQNHAWPFLEWRFQVCTYVFKPIQVKIRHKCSVPQQKQIIRAESRNSMHLLQVYHFFPFPPLDSLVVLALTLWNTCVSLSYKTMVVFFLIAILPPVSFFVYWFEPLNSPINVLIGIRILSS